MKYIKTVYGIFKSIHDNKAFLGTMTTDKEVVMIEFSVAPEDIIYQGERADELDLNKEVLKNE